MPNTFMRMGVLLVPDMCTDENLRLVRQCGATDIVLTCPGFGLEELQAAVKRIRSFELRVDVIERFVPHDKIVHYLEGRDEQVANIKQLIRNMGECGISVRSAKLESTRPPLSLPLPLPLPSVPVPLVDPCESCCV
jgi:D-mannonate dehydratase